MEKLYFGRVSRIYGILADVACDCTFLSLHPLIRIAISGEVSRIFEGRK